MTTDTPAAAPITAEREALRNAAERLRDAYNAATAGKWRKGLTTHHTVTDLPTAPNYKIGEFHHADDAHFCDVAHEVAPMLFRAALSAPEAAPPADPLLGQALAALVRYANACDADAKTVAVIQALEARIDSAPPAASGVDALWVDKTMELAARIEAAGARRGREGRAPSDHEPEMIDLRTHLSTALKGEQR